MATLRLHDGTLISIEGIRVRGYLSMSVLIYIGGIAI